jgi:hypothetical protein
MASANGQFCHLIVYNLLLYPSAYQVRIVYSLIPEFYIFHFTFCICFRFLNFAFFIFNFEFIFSGCAPFIVRGLLSLQQDPRSGQAPLQHPKTSVYRCFLSDLAGFTASCCIGPGHQHTDPAFSPGAAGLNREFSSAIADCRFRAPLTPRLAQPQKLAL